MFLEQNFMQIMNLLGNWRLLFITISQLNWKSIFDVQKHAWLVAFSYRTLSRTHPSENLSTVGRGLVERLTSARLRAAAPLSNPGTLTACKSAGIQ